MVYISPHISMCKPQLMEDKVQSTVVGVMWTGCLPRRRQRTKTILDKETQTRFRTSFLIHVLSKQWPGTNLMKRGMVVGRKG
jgi:hypothetical protein